MNRAVGIKWFKIDLIVWKSYQNAPVLGRPYKFKIDLIVWKFNTHTIIIKAARMGLK